MKMNEKQLAELKSLKSTLRCLVVSNPVAMDTNNLRREYKVQMGENIPIFGYGYRDIVAFLKERCSDVFTFSGMPTNPTLTPIITKDIIHIDKMIAKQRVPTTKAYKPKRSRTYETQSQPTKNRNSYSWEKAFADKKSNRHNNYIEINKEVKRQDQPYESHREMKTLSTINIKPTPKSPIQNESISPNSWEKSKPNHIEHLALNSVPESISPESEADSGTHSSGKGERGHKLFVSNLKELISEHPKGIWSVELLNLYRDRFGLELDYERRGYNCLVSMCTELTDVFSVHRPNQLGDWLLMDCHATPPVQEKRDIKQLLLQRQASRAQEVQKEPDNDDALPGIDFDPSMYPPDCLHFLESVPRLTWPYKLQEDMLEVIVAEVADPSHFWFQLRGSEYSDAMEVIMDQMTDYYRSPEGVERRMAAGAVRVGQYCAANFEGDWHRSVIVQILPKGMVKVRHIDYGTVECVSSAGLHYLPRVWAVLPAQALRGRLARVAPATTARWPHSTARHFLNMVREKPLLANVLDVDPEEQIVYMILVDTSSTEDIFINDELVRHGLAEPFYEEDLSFDDMPVDFFLPTFDAFENGRAFNYAEKTALLNKGICPEEVQDPTGVCGKPRKNPSRNLLHRRDELPNQGIGYCLSGNSDLGSSLESINCLEDEVSKLVSPQEESLAAYLPLNSSSNRAEPAYHQLLGPASPNNLQFQPQYCMATDQMLKGSPIFYQNQRGGHISPHLPLPLPCNANVVMMPHYPIPNIGSPSSSPVLPSSPNPYSMPPIAYYPHFNTNLDQTPYMTPTPNALRMITKKQHLGPSTDNNLPNVHPYINTRIPPTWPNCENKKLEEIAHKYETKPHFPLTMPSNAVLESPPNFHSSKYTCVTNDNSHPGAPGFQTNRSPSSPNQYVVPQKRPPTTCVTSESSSCNIASSPPKSLSPTAPAFNFDLNAPPVQLSNLDLVVLQTLITSNPTLAKDYLENIKVRNNVSRASLPSPGSGSPHTTQESLATNNSTPSLMAIPATSFTSAEVVASTVTVTSHVKMSCDPTKISVPPGFDITDGDQLHFFAHNAHGSTG